MRAYTIIDANDPVPGIQIRTDDDGNYLSALEGAPDKIFIDPEDYGRVIVNRAGGAVVENVDFREWKDGGRCGYTITAPGKDNEDRVLVHWNIETHHQTEPSPGVTLLCPSISMHGRLGALAVLPVGGCLYANQLAKARRGGRPLKNRPSMVLHSLLHYLGKGQFAQTVFSEEPISRPTERREQPQP